MDKSKLKRLEELTIARIHPEPKLPTIIINREDSTQSLIYPDGSEKMITEAQADEMRQKRQAQFVLIGVVSSRSKELLKRVLAGERTEK